jgi:hypothetical protein
MPLAVGSRLGYGDVTALVGGSGGQVYQATDMSLNRPKPPIVRWLDL